MAGTEAVVLKMENVVVYTPQLVGLGDQPSGNAHVTIPPNTVVVMSGTDSGC